MIATRLFQECPLTVIVTGGRAPAPSASTASGGTSSPRIGSGGSTRARNVTTFSLPIGVGSGGTGGDLPQVAVRVTGVAGVAGVPAPRGGGRLLDHAAAGGHGVVHRLVHGFPGVGV